MFMSPGLTAALDRIAERAADVRRAYTPGATPRNDDVATPEAAADFTLDPLSVVLPGGAYLVTRDDGRRQIYTRDGALALRDGRVTGAGGRPVLGVLEGGGEPVELRVDPVDEALGRIRDAAILRDGTVTYLRDTIDPRTGERAAQRVVVGKLLLAHFPAATRLAPNDGSYAAPLEGVAPQCGFAGDAPFGLLQPNRREHSRIDVNESIVRLKEAYLAFDALQAAETAKNHLGKTVMDLLK
jgi:flagellar basal body rod protein FlgG